MKLCIPIKKHLLGLLLIGLINCSFNGAFAHNSNEKVYFQEQYLSEILDEMGERYKVFFNYELELIKNIKVDFEFKKGESLTNAVKRLMKKSNLSYELTNEKFIIIYKNNRQGKKTARKAKRKIRQLSKLEKSGKISLQRNNSNPNTRSLELMETVLTDKKKILQTIQGTIKDTDDQPLIGATVLEKGTSNGTITDFEGKYSLEVGSNAAVLVFSYTGYKDQEVTVGSQTNIDVTLLTDISILDEVVVVGYGTERRSQITGAVSSVDPATLNRAVSASVDNALQGLSAGVMVTSNNAAPGGGVSIRIRGAGGVNNSEPLYVIDGFPISVGENENRSPLSTINPQDIKSISILKDAASAAIYGTRAANGVILITTKRGRTNQKGIASVTLRTGIQQLGNTLDLMDASTYVDYINTAYQNAGRQIPQGFENPSSFGAGTDWIETITRSAAVTDVQASFSGGSQKGNYFLSLGGFKQDGVVRGTNFERLTARLNADQKINDFIKTGASIAFTNSKQAAVDRLRGVNTQLSFATLFYPTIPVYGSDGDYAPTPANGFYKPQTNPLFIAEGPRTPPVRNTLLGNVYAEVSLLPRLKFKTTAYYTFENTQTENFGRIYDLGAAASTEQSVLKAQNTGNTFLIENVLSYNFAEGDHFFSALAGQSFQKSENEFLRVSGEYLEEGNFVINELAASLNVDNIINENSIISYFGKLNYSYKDKYLLTAMLRRDGSSRFGDNNKWGVFPSLSAGWNISDEDFFPQGGVLSSLKLRGGWGQVGFDVIDNYAATAVVNTGTFNYPFGNLAGTVSPGSGIAGRLPNPDLQWETVEQFSVGFDATFFKEALNLTVEYYDKKRKDMLVPVPQSAVTGISNGGKQGQQFQNIGTLTDKGIEFSASYNGKVGDFIYGIGANFTTINNEITGVPAPINNFNFAGNNLTITENGSPVGQFRGFIADGIFQSQAEVDAHASQGSGTAPGDLKFRDISGPDGTADGVIDNFDRTIIGNPIPALTFGFNLSFGYKGLDFNLQGYGNSGNDVFSLTKLELLNSERSENKLNHTPWSASNSSRDYFRAIATDPNNNNRLSSYYVEDGSFLRVRNIELGYSLPSRLLNKIDISKLRLYVNLQNPFTLTGYSGANPEVGNVGGSNLGSGIDYFVYPAAKIYSFGLNLNF